MTMTSSRLYALGSAAISIAALFIPFWQAPFALSLLLALMLPVPLAYGLLTSFASHAIACMVFCSMANGSGSGDLVERIGRLFLGISPVLLVVISAMVYGFTATLGAWSGLAIRKFQTGTV
ncbi:MAG: hypothetical protein KBF37_10200 [Saprospiraceae bacterium]|jgi:hypothetical protein|nr:hypothetical protein [Saprospiraceae bacterium]MBV6473558.1 hypothetical protein [Saprospiraceae bacterium]